MATQQRFPTGDYEANWTVFPASPITRWDKVDEDPPDDNTSYINATAANAQRFTFTAFAILAGSAINFVQVFYRHKKTASQACNIRSALRVGGTNYLTTDPGVNPTNNVWNNRTFNYTVNPKTGVAWTVDDVNGVGGNALQAFGLNSSDASPNPYCTECYAIVDYSPSQTISGAGNIASAEAFGGDKLNMNINPGSIASLEGFGSPKLNLNIQPSGILTSEGFGMAKLNLNVKPGAIASAEIFGTPIVSVGGGSSVKNLYRGGFPNRNRFNRSGGWQNV